MEYLNTQDAPPVAEGSQDGHCLKGKWDWAPSGVSAEQCAWHGVSTLSCECSGIASYRADNSHVFAKQPDGQAGHLAA